MKCGVCGVNRPAKNLRTTRLPVSFIVNGHRRDFPAGVKLCDIELRRIAEATSEGQKIAWSDAAWRREDGARIL